MMLLGVCKTLLQAGIDEKAVAAWMVPQDKIGAAADDDAGLARELDNGLGLQDEQAVAVVRRNAQAAQPKG